MPFILFPQIGIHGRGISFDAGMTQSFLVLLSAPGESSIEVLCVSARRAYCHYDLPDDITGLGQ